MCLSSGSWLSLPPPKTHVSAFLLQLRHTRAVFSLVLILLDNRYDRCLSPITSTLSPTIFLPKSTVCFSRRACMRHGLRGNDTALRRHLR